MHADLILIKISSSYVAESGKLVSRAQHTINYIIDKYASRSTFTLGIPYPYFQILYIERLLAVHQAVPSLKHLATLSVRYHFNRKKWRAALPNSLVECVESNFDDLMCPFKNDNLPK